MGFFERLKSGMSKSRDNLGGKLDSVFSLFTRVDEELLEEIEERCV